MSKTVKQAIEEIKDEAASQQLARLNQHQGTRAHAQALMLLGGIKATQAQAEANYAQSMRALAYFGEQKLYEELGYKDFATFLDQCEDSPLSKHEYYNRLKLLSSEGDETFNLMTSLRVSLATRRALKKGEITVEGDIVRVGDEEIPIEERARIKSILKTLADKTAEQKRTIERGKKEIKELKRAADEQAAPAPRPLVETETTASHLCLSIVALFADLERTLKAMQPAERAQHIGEFHPRLQLAWENFQFFSTGLKKTVDDPDLTDDDIAAVFDDDDE